MRWWWGGVTTHIGISTRGHCHLSSQMRELRLRKIKQLAQVYMAKIGRAGIQTQIYLSDAKAHLLNHFSKLFVSQAKVTKLMFATEIIDKFQNLSGLP